MPTFNQGERFTLHKFRAYRNNPPAGAEQTTNGSTAVKRIKAAEARHEQALFDQMTGRYTGLHERSTARVEEADAALDLLEENLTALT